MPLDKERISEYDPLKIIIKNYLQLSKDFNPLWQKIP
jgi:hypothetical protein